MQRRNTPETAGRIQNQRAFEKNASARAYIDQRPKMIWDFLKPAFGGLIAPTDIDGLVERNGNYLLIECKQSGTTVPKGQQYLLKDLNERHGFTVFVVTGFTADTIASLDIVWPRAKRHEKFDNITPAGLVEQCQRWFHWAQDIRRPKPVGLTPQEQTLEQWWSDYDNG